MRERERKRERERGGQRRGGREVRLITELTDTER